MPLHIPSVRRPSVRDTALEQRVEEALTRIRATILDSSVIQQRARDAVETMNRANRNGPPSGLARDDEE